MIILQANPPFRACVIYVYLSDGWEKEIEQPANAIIFEE